MNKELEYEYVAGSYTVKFKGDLELLLNEIDHLLDYYRNEMEAYTYNDDSYYIEELKKAGFEVSSSDED